MQLLNLSVHNLGVFRGHHTFDLATEGLPNGGARHLTLISGHNGAGKSTLFQALALALHGPLALGDRISRQAYSEFLLSRLHRTQTGTTIASSDGGISLDFQYVQSGRPLRIHVERHWERNGPNVLETLTVLQDGEPPEVDPADLQSWLNDLLPPGLSTVLFFDAERLNALATPEQHNDALSDTWRRLLGLDLVDRLQTDLAYYTLQRGSGKRLERLRAATLEHQATIDALNAQLNVLQAETASLIEDKERLVALVARQELRLAAEGGSYAERRPQLQQRFSVLQVEIENLSARLRDLAAGLLPFALAPELCQALSRRLTLEAETHRRLIAEQALQERVADLEAAFGKQELWRDLDIPPHTREAITSRLITILRDDKTAGGDAPLLLHHLADPDQERIQNWIALVLSDIPQQVRELGERLQALKSERREIEKDLGRAPDDEVIAPIHSELTRLQDALADIEAQQRALDKQIGALQFQIDDETRQLQLAHDQLSEAQAVERQLELAERSKLVLRTYEDALTRRRLGDLEERIAAAFNSICRKEDMLAAVRINPDDFCVELRNAENREVSLADFSAGERQLYALSVLWALRQVSGQQLPLVVDTPLARLDEVHRERLVHQYFPSVSNQVVLFATQAELDSELLEQLRPYLAQVYQLHYDSSAEETVVTTNSLACSTSAPVTIGI